MNKERGKKRNEMGNIPKTETSVWVNVEDLPCSYLPHLPPTPFHIHSSERVGLTWGVSKAWHLQLRLDQGPPHCIHVEQVIPP